MGGSTRIKPDAFGPGASADRYHFDLHFQSAITYMSNKRSKKQSKPPSLYTSLGISTNIAVGPLGFRAEPHPKGDQSRPYHE